MPSTPPQALYRGPANGFAAGYTSIIREADQPGPGRPSMDFGLHRQGSGERLAETPTKETAWVLLRGSAEVEFGGQSVSVQRGNLFDEPPSALHVSPGTPVTLRAGAEGAEWALIRTTQDKTFPPRLYLPSDLKPEYRGAGLVQGACLRNVRLIFDYSTRPEANLVVGEVVNYPGRWSSYPPHHHLQSEIYHYRFTEPQGYGHAEIGDDVMKVRENDTIFIPPNLDHAQVSAPGYGMYYLWMIRHLPGNPYTGFTFTEEHKWTLDPAQQGWQPSPSTPSP
jgi:5-deoxy-glucuronate isomerase